MKVHYFKASAEIVNFKFISIDLFYIY